MTSDLGVPTGRDIRPPRSNVGPVAWLQQNLFSTWYNSGFTVFAGTILAFALWFVIGWTLLQADWRVIATLGGRVVIGQYNIEAACPGQDCFWRPQAALLLVNIVLGMVWGVSKNSLPKKVALVGGIVSSAFALLPYGLDSMGLDVRLLLMANIPAVVTGWAIGRHTRLGNPRSIIICSIGIFFVTLILLRGVPGIAFLQPVSVIYWGGLMLNLLLAIAGIGLSLPIGIGLALGRRSRLTVLKVLCILFIEVFRGVPLITLLFMSQVLVPLAFPEDFPQNSLFRAAIVITLFSSAYMAENVRGGLQSLHPGQAEAARALGLPSWQTTLFISLPQAIRNVIPAIVGQFISLFKDTTLVYIIGMLDVMEISRAFIQGNPEFLASAKEVFVFLAIVFWIFTYGMSYVSRGIEGHLGVGKR